MSSSPPRSSRSWTLEPAGPSQRHSARYEMWLCAAAGALLVIALLHLTPGLRLVTPGAGRCCYSSRLLCAGRCRGPPRLRVRLGHAAVRRGRQRCRAGRAPVPSGLGAGGGRVAGGHHGAGCSCAGRGMAVGALLAGQSRRRLTLWLVAMCQSPIAGAVAISGTELPAAAEPLLLAVSAGALAQAAQISLGAARRTRGRWLLAGPAAVASLTAAAVTAVAVRVGG